jgi:hypothetical protein
LLAGRLFTFILLSIISPLSADSNPAINFMMVVLPEPEGPSIVINLFS